MEPDEKRKAVRHTVASQRGEAVRLADRIWELAEPPMHEHQSAALLAAYLEQQGFRVKFSVPSMPTAFEARWGRARPAIGFLGEYDALPDCGPRRGTYGHGCGHNLLGVGSAVAAVAAARLLADGGKKGSVVYWGCPAEEALTGKVYMARDGAFRGLDACMAWHPSSSTMVNATGGSALDSLLFDFRGRTAHGAGAHGGRSALDGAVLTDVAANYLREHVPENVRIHCVLRDSGTAPNVVPEYAQIWYYTRGKDRKEVEDVTRRLLLCAKGAAMATETRMTHKRLAGVYSRLRNAAIAQVMLENMALMGMVRATKADQARVEELGKEPEFDTATKPTISERAGRGSSDEDNVSWLTPLGRIVVACVAKGTRGHHRDYSAQVRLPFAHRGMLRAAEVMAAAAWDLTTDGRKLRKVRREFEKATRDFKYDPLVGKAQRPPVELYDVD